MRTLTFIFASIVVVVLTAPFTISAPALMPVVGLLTYMVLQLEKILMYWELKNKIDVAMFEKLFPE